MSGVGLGRRVGLIYRVITAGVEVGSPGAGVEVGVSDICVLRDPAQSTISLLPDGSSDAWICHACASVGSACVCTYTGIERLLPSGSSLLEINKLVDEGDTFHSVIFEDMIVYASSCGTVSIIHRIGVSSPVALATVNVSPTDVPGVNSVGVTDAVHVTAANTPTRRLKKHTTHARYGRILRMNTPLFLSIIYCIPPYPLGIEELNNASPRFNDSTA